MLKKILLVFFILAAVMTLSARSVHANTGDDVTNAVSGQFAIPGVTCGVPAPTNQSTPNANNKCCNISQASSVKDEVSNRFPEWCLLKLSIPGVSLVKSAVGFITGGLLGGGGGDEIRICPSDFVKIPVEFVAGLPAVDNILNLSRNSPVSACLGGDSGGVAASDPNCVCREVQASSKVLCDDYLKNAGEYNACVECAGKGIWTGIGCIRTTVAGFVQETLLTWAIGLAGLVALLCIIYSAFVLQVSGGNPERIKKAREYLTNCIIGLLLIIFSVFILQVVGVNILGIPGFG